MRKQFLTGLTVIVLVTAGTWLIRPWTSGQSTSPTPPIDPKIAIKEGPVDKKAPVLVENPSPAPKSNPPSNNTEAPRPKTEPPIDRFMKDLDNNPILQQRILTTKRAAEWLQRDFMMDGRFRYGVIPLLRAELDGDHPLRQAIATFALARAGKFIGKEEYSARASQAILTLLTLTKVDSQKPGVRYPSLPSVACNRVGLAGMIVLAIHELPSPNAELLKVGEELCEFIRTTQLEDGSLHYADGTDASLKSDPEGINQYPGMALYAVALSQRLKPAPWKTEFIAKAFPYYVKRFRSNPESSFVPWQTAAYVEAFLTSRKAEYAQYVFEMNDWICGLQYQSDRLDPRHPMWLGGFRPSANGKPVESAPRIDSAWSAQSLADSCRLLRMMKPEERPDPQRYDRYRSSLGGACMFITGLQYTEDKTQHFVAEYRPYLVGGFHASAQDGQIRVDYTAAALSAHIQFFMSGASER